VLSADRPAEVRGVGANQTIDQVGIFGRSTRLFHEIATPDHRTGQVEYWRATLSRAVWAARGRVSGDPGPVQLNLPLREPLVPDGDGTWLEPLDGRRDGGPWTDVSWGGDMPAIADEVEVPDDLGLGPERGGSDEPSALEGPARTLVVIGDAPPLVRAEALAAAARAGWPVLAEPGPRTDGAEVIDCGPLVAGSDDWLADNVPDRVLMVGRPTLSRSVNRLLSGAIAPVEAVAAKPEWADPGHAVQRLYPPHALPTIVGQGGDPAFLAAWRKAGERARVAVGSVLDQAPPIGLAATRGIVEAIAPESMLYLGSSSIARDVDLVGGRLPAVVYANRGVAGIDGTVSSAIGAALGHRGAPAYAIVGDLTFLHDSNGLIIGADEPRPDLCMVVVNDNGGGIFSLLEQGAPEHASRFERIFGTPHGMDLAKLCEATGTPYERARLASLPDVLAPRSGLRVVEIPVRRDKHRAVHANLRAAVASALA
jgi:2-succinyl-5-enolpyruvyl-6-hydroxy-3-cyclohexene-1-carboxylate synthase